MTEKSSNQVTSAAEMETGMLGFLLSLSRSHKSIIIILLGLFSCVLATYVSFAIRYESLIDVMNDRHIVQGMQVAILLSTSIFVPLFIISGSHRSIMRVGLIGLRSPQLRFIISYISISTIIFASANIDNVPRSIGFLNAVLVVFFLAAAKSIIAHVLLTDRFRTSDRTEVSVVAVYGADASSSDLVTKLHARSRYRVVAVIDDDPTKISAKFGSVRVVDRGDFFLNHSPQEIPLIFLVKEKITRSIRKEIVDSFLARGYDVRLVPESLDIALGRFELAEPENFDVVDLLMRERVDHDDSKVAGLFEGKSILITGAGGSIGTGLSRALVSLRPRKLLLLDVSELSIYRLEREIAAGGLLQEIEIHFILGSLLDETLVMNVLQDHNINFVIHAAAYKHVPLVENNFLTGLKNNVIGTLNLLRAVERFPVESFTLISTDKAVRPTNIMGVSKRIAEICVQGFAQKNRETKYSTVRFGNVLDSSGSVVPLFRSQIHRGGPVTVTHPNVTRYFMTIPEACSLVLHAMFLSRANDVFLLDMGDPVKIIDLARKMIKLYGYSVRDVDNPSGDIEIKITGLRPGEKLYEELLVDGAAEGTTHPRIFRADERLVDTVILLDHIFELEDELMKFNPNGVVSLLHEIVPEYNPDPKVV